MKYRSIRRWSVVAVAALLSAVCLTGAQAQDPVPRIVLLGDSWAHFMQLDNTLDDVLASFGLEADYTWDSIAFGGTKASQWASVNLQRSTGVFLNANPTIDIVIMCLGGNDIMYGEPDDFFDYYGDPAAEDAFLDRIANNVATVVEGITKLRPGLRVCICGYEYANAIKKVGNNCDTTPEEALAMCNIVNEIMIRCEKKIVQRVQNLERCQFVNNYGVLQHYLGYPGTNVPSWLEPWEGECKHHPHWDPAGVDAYRFGPGEAPLPGQLADNYVPFEGGDPTFMKSPWQGMLYYENQWADELIALGLDPQVLGIENMGPIDDWIHLSAEGHELLVGNCFDVCVEAWLNQYPYPEIASIRRCTTNPILPGEVWGTTGAEQVAFEVTFTEPVSGVDELDFSVVMEGGVGNAFVESAEVDEAKDGSTFIVTVNTGDGNGTINLALLDNDSIVNSLGNPLGGTGVSAMSFVYSEAYTIDRSTTLPLAAAPLALALLALGGLALRRS